MVKGDMGLSLQTPSMTRPQPRPPRSEGERSQIRVRNRRRAWLDRHENYFESEEHELADPILYDALIRRFQTPDERRHEGQRKGYSRVLEADILRGESKLARLAFERRGGSTCDARGSPNRGYGMNGHGPAGVDLSNSSSSSSSNGSNGSNSSNSSIAYVDSPIRSRFDDEAAESGFDLATLKRSEGLEQWREFVAGRFVDGDDEDFDYSTVDGNEDLDEMERRDEEDEWFDEESPGEAENGLELEGETGVLDY